jgi:hypothetical protein
MDNSINHKPGGPAAHTPNINPNPNPNPNPKTDMNETNNDDPVTLKQAAEKFQCAASSLKNNIKSAKLAATQSGEKAPYMVRLSDVERFLRDTPGIASIFHPATNAESADIVAEAPSATPTSAAPAPAVTLPPVREPTSGVATAPPAKQAVPTRKEFAGGFPFPDEGAVPPNPATVSRQRASTQEEAHTTPAPPPDATNERSPKRRRRNRGRGRGLGAGVGVPPESSGMGARFISLLAGTTPGERLKLMACLNELSAMVASA